MAIGWQSAFRRVESTLRNRLYVRRNKALPCDSLNPKLCMLCHAVRDKLTGSNTVSLMNPTVVFTKHGNYLIGDTENSVQTYRGWIITSCGVNSPFLDKLVEEVLNHVRKEGKT